MTDDSQYETHKRKYEENTSPSPARPPCRATGFSAPIVPNNSDVVSLPVATTYGSVPPPMNEFEMAKKKLKELASRALNADAKRSKADNGGGFAPGANLVSSG